MYSRASALSANLHVHVRACKSEILKFSWPRKESLEYNGYMIVGSWTDWYATQNIQFFEHHRQSSSLPTAKKSSMTVWSGFDLVSFSFSFPCFLDFWSFVCLSDIVFNFVLSIPTEAIVSDVPGWPTDSSFDLNSISSSGSQPSSPASICDRTKARSCARRESVSFMDVEPALFSPSSEFRDSLLFESDDGNKEMYFSSLGKCYVQLNQSPAHRQNACSAIHDKTYEDIIQIDP